MIYTTTDFDVQQATDCTLLIAIGTGSHMLAVVDQAGELTFAASYAPGNVVPEIKAVIEHPFSRVKIGVADNRYMFIPSEVYDEQQHNTYLRYLPFDGIGAISVADVPRLNVKMLHQCSRIGWTDMAARFPDAEHYPHVWGVLNAMAAQGRQTNEPLVVIERHAPWATIVIFVDGKFLYAHDFEVYQAEDLTYHLAAVFDQFGLADRQPTILLAGEIEADDLYYNGAAAFGSKIDFADSSGLTGIGVPDEMVPYQHRFLSLLGLLPCVS